MGNLSDTLLLVIVAILLLAGKKDITGTARNIGKTLEEFKRKQNEFKNELLTELNETGEVHKSIVKEITYDDYHYNYVKQTPSDEKMKRLEDEINRLKAEIERG